MKKLLITLITATFAMTTNAQPQLRADNILSPLQLILTDEIDLGNEINGDDMIDPDKPIGHYSIEGVNGLSYLWQLEPAEAGSIISHGNAVDIVWDFRHNLTEATLSVSADAICSQETLNKTIQISPVSFSEESLSGKPEAQPLRVPLALVLSRMLTKPTASMLKPSAFNLTMEPLAPS